MGKPVKELKGLAKTKLLLPQSKQTVSFKISKMDLASFDENISAWTAEAGEYKIYIGASLKDIKLNTSFTLPQNLIVKEVNNVLAPGKKLQDYNSKMHF